MSTDRDKLRVFVSYAREDASAFAEELLAGLEVAGMDGILDRHDISGGEDWKARLGGLIQSADTLVFIITPASVVSKMCRWELERAQSLSKRILPVLRIDAEEQATPEQIRRLNYIFFREDQSFSRALRDLANALRTDLIWIREHTRLELQARRWMEKQKNAALLLRGPELQAAIEWRGQWRAPAPEPTPFHQDFINESASAEGLLVKRERARQRRVVMALSAAVLVFGALSAISLYSTFRAVRSEAEAQSLYKVAADARDRAIDSELEARRTAAKALFYEGLYWFRSAEASGPGEIRSANYSKALRRFEDGRKLLDGTDATLKAEGELAYLGDVSLKAVLSYGQRFVQLCLTKADPGHGERAPENVPEFFVKSLNAPQVCGGAAH